MSGTGKSFYSKYLYEKLSAMNKKIKLLDGDTIRDNYNVPLGFSKDEIFKNNMYISEICEKEYQKYDVTIVSVISPYESLRKIIKEIFRNDIYFIYIYANIESLKLRDTKELYSKADNNEIKDLIGYSETSKYEIPTKPDLILDTSENSKPEKNFSILNNFFGLDIK
tara:strand:+ start:80 stop:580 length:501 start_codon:yes stop_codon:yes gene_type:complete